MIIKLPDTPDFSFDEEAGEIRLALPPVFSFSECLQHLTRSSTECMHRVEEGDILKLMSIDDQPFLLRISDSGDYLRIACLNRRIEDTTIWLELARGLREWLDLERDMTPFYSLMKDDPMLGKLTEQYAGLRIVGIPDLFEALCWAIMGQQINLAFAYTLKQRFVSAYGSCLTWNGHAHWLFPKPRDIAALSPHELTKLQLTARKAEYIVHVASLMDEGSLSKEGLLAATGNDFQAIQKLLLNIRGIGPWTAHYVLMRCFRDPSAFPIGDAGLHNALKRLLGRSEKPGLKEIADIFSRWRNWEAYAVFYLWRSLIP
ncbi:DNA-3-methyladenine glycosylase 2 [Paenibacillus sp. J5C_2022]|uniref:DNA-3-methyladenine glycosylase family protein n=1 Tax=Paenibacillus sp. J5C2022 TaxID=2977129 RepID=UPI0021D3BABD|nr:DNA-3-methyladenine glycosylase 2 [Paenibacillus sp. J5C2022]MCU6708251.1 DNA-3-methyladenine glycosylase 2 [Paenibacillus sp. J5C2022]